MTAKEKAHELYAKYEFVYVQNYTSKHEVVQCAIIAVDEIIESYNGIFDDCIIHPSEYSGCGNMEKYWQEVKQEIEKL